MLVFSSMCIHHVLATIVILQIGIFQVETTLPTNFIKVRRTQLVRTRPASPSASSTSSHNVESESKPMASTSTFQQEIGVERQEIDLKPLTEAEAKRVRLIEPNFVDPLAVTQSEHLDPMRDGVFARMRNNALRYGAAAAIGSSISAGGLAAKQLLSQYIGNTSQLVSSSSSTTNQNFSNQSEDIKISLDSD